MLAITLTAPPHSPQVSMSMLNTRFKRCAQRVFGLVSHHVPGSFCLYPAWPVSPDVSDQTPAEKRASRTWAKRLKRVFDIDIETCEKCGGNVKIIASIEDPAVIRKILVHLADKVPSATTELLPQCRAPPRTGLLTCSEESNCS